MNKKEIVAFYNVENLFDTIDDPDKFDDEFTPEGKREWTEKRYENKIYKISGTIKDLALKNGVPPFLMGLTEIENEKVLKDLQFHLPAYQYIHYESKDERGIDVALMYDPEKFFVTHSEPIYIDLSQVSEEEDYTRDILYVNGSYQNQLIHIFVGHLPSKRNQDINLEKRIFALRNLAKKIDSIYQKEPQPAIIIMGDMNENPTRQILRDEIGFTSDIEKVREGVFYNPFIDEFEKGGYSLYHKNDGMLFDQIILSPYFFSKGSKLKYSFADVFDDLKLKEWQPKFKNKPYRTYVGRKYLGGYSDHFPVFVEFNDKYDPFAKYIDSTYLKTPEEAEISNETTLEKVKELTEFAIQEHIKCVMIRPNFVAEMKKMVSHENSDTLVGTVIDFPLGNSSLNVKLEEAKSAIENGADELDFVINYEAFKIGDLETVEEDFKVCTHYVLEEGKTIKWIIETAALTEEQIEDICERFSEISQRKFRNNLNRIFLKSSTGYYKSSKKGYIGAIPKDIQLMLDSGYPLPIKASGGIKTREEAEKYIQMGVKRIGTSSAKEILDR